LLLAPEQSSAQQTPAKIPRIGILSPAERPSTKIFDAFRIGLRDLGYVNGQNITIEYRLTAGDLGRLPVMAADLVRLPVDVIVADGSKSAQIAYEATRTIPIVGVAFGPGPVAAGLIVSFAHPGGNVTGFVVMTQFEIALLGPRARLDRAAARPHGARMLTGKQFTGTPTVATSV
jgi:putative ABC transport system substrate-binding protein